MGSGLTSFFIHVIYENILIEERVSDTYYLSL